MLYVKGRGIVSGREAGAEPASLQKSILAKGFVEIQQSPLLAKYGVRTVNLQVSVYGHPRVEDGKKRFLGLGPEDLFLGTMPTLDPVFDHVYDSAELDRRDLRFSLDKESRPCIRLNSTEQPSSAVSKSVPNKPLTFVICLRPSDIDFLGKVESLAKDPKARPRIKRIIAQIVDQLRPGDPGPSPVEVTTSTTPKKRRTSKDSAGDPSSPSKRSKVANDSDVDKRSAWELLDLAKAQQTRPSDFVAEIGRRLHRNNASALAASAKVVKNLQRQVGKSKEERICQDAKIAEAEKRAAQATARAEAAERAAAAASTQTAQAEARAREAEKSGRLVEKAAMRHQLETAQELEAEKQRTLQLEQRISALQQRNTALEQQAAVARYDPWDHRYYQNHACVEPVIDAS